MPRDVEKIGATVVVCRPNEWRIEKGRRHNWVCEIRKGDEVREVIADSVFSAATRVELMPEWYRVGFVPRDGVCEVIRYEDEDYGEKVWLYC